MTNFKCLSRLVLLAGAWSLCGAPLGWSQTPAQLEHLSELGTSSSSGSEFIPNFDWDPLFPVEDYELGPGDIISVHGSQGRNLGMKIYVSPTYELFVPAVGSVNVKGLKFGQLNKILRQKLQVHYPRVETTISLYRPRTFKVQLLGEVNTPGSKSATSMIRLHEFLLAYGGLRPLASTAAVEITNVRLKTKKTVDYQDYLLRGNLDGNPYIKDGDSIFLPGQKNVVLIKGNVLHAGRFEFIASAVSLKEVVEKNLGGLVSGQATVGQVVITRIENNQPHTTYSSAEKFFNSSTPINYENFELRNGDEIFFPIASVQNPGAAPDTVFVTGEVRLPGPYPYKPSVPLTSYIAGAGGVMYRGNYDQITVYKASGARISIHANPSVEPGDTIHVPEKTFKFWQDHLTILMTFLTLATTTIALSR